MPNFGEQPKKELSLETPEQEAERLRKESQAEPRFVGESIQEVVAAAEMQAAADMQKTNKILTEIKSMPTIDDKTQDILSTRPLSQEDERAMTAERDQFGGEYQKRADERNKNRKWYEKLLRKDTVTAEDIAQEEALQINKRVDTLQEQGNETAGKIAEQLANTAWEFSHKSEDLIRVQEKARKFGSKAVEALEAGDFARAKEESDKAYNNAPQEDRSDVYDGLRSLLNRRIDAVIVDGDMEKMKELVSTYSYPIHEIGLDNLARMPKEVIESQKLQESFEGSLEGLILNGHQPRESAQLAQELVQRGLIDTSKVQKIFSSQEVQSHLSHDISGLIKYARDPQEAKQTADKYMTLGLMSREAAAKALQV